MTDPAAHDLAAHAHDLAAHDQAVHDYARRHRAFSLTGPAAHVAAADGDGPDFVIARIALISPTVVRVVITPAHTQEAAVRAVAELTVDGMTFNVGGRHWSAALVQRAQPLLHHLPHVRDLLREDIDATARAMGDEAAKYRSGQPAIDTDSWDNWQHLRTLLLSAYELEDPTSRGVALRTIASGYTGPVDTLRDLAAGATSPPLTPALVDA